MPRYQVLTPRGYPTHSASGGAPKTHEKPEDAVMAYLKRRVSPEEGGVYLAVDVDAATVTKVDVKPIQPLPPYEVTVVEDEPPSYSFSISATPAAHGRLVGADRDGRELRGGDLIRTHNGNEGILTGSISERGEVYFRLTKASNPRSQILAAGNTTCNFPRNMVKLAQPVKRDKAVFGDRVRHRKKGWTGTVERRLMNDAGVRVEVDPGFCDYPHRVWSDRNVEVIS